MNHDAFFSALAELNAQYWWARALFTLAVVWLLIDLARHAPWAQVGLKIALALTCVTVGVAYYGLFLPSALPPEAPTFYRVWLHRAGSVGFIAAGALAIADTAGNGTHLVLPERGWRLVAVLGGAIVGLGFPAFELVMGHVWPRAQAFGVAPAPLVVVLLPLLGAAQPMAWTGQVWFWLMVAAGAELGVVAQVFDIPHAQPVVALAVVAGLVMRLSYSGQPARDATSSSASR
jgi:hypothetical protein